MGIIPSAVTVVAGIAKMPLSVERTPNQGAEYTANPQRYAILSNCNAKVER
jgi:hypothetical protein